MEADPNLTPAYLAGKLDEYVKQAGRDTLIRNADTDKNARYARIPDGRACDFCRMLGSRGFVYHTEAKAKRTKSGEDDYHPFCNCQIAVCFDPFMEEYDVGWVHVTRGHGDGMLVRPGRDGSETLRPVDIEELFDEYKQMGMDFNRGSRKKDYTEDSRNGAKLPDDEYDAAMRRIADARSLDELRAICEAIEHSWPDNGNGRDKTQWSEMRAHVQRVKSQLKYGQKQKPMTERERLVEQARRAVPNQARAMGISEDEAMRRFDLLVDSNTDAQLRAYIRRYGG